MSYSIWEKITVEKSLIFIVISAILIVFIFIFFLFFGQFTKSIRVLSPNGGEEWEIGQTYEITWQAKGVEKVGIVLFKGSEPKWIAQDISAGSGKYEWKIYPGQEYGAGFWIAVVEYPWQKGNKIDYSDGSFTITYPELLSCDSLSVEKEWPYLPSDLPNLRRVFITKNSFSGNLDGLEGADKICQTEAEEQGFEREWQAFLGGDSDNDLAIERLKRTPRGTDGIFILADSAATLIRGADCHRLLAENFDEFLVMFSGLKIINEERMEKDFLADFGNIWLGRLDEKSKKNCIAVAGTEEYTFTITCQNWTQANRTVEGYPVPKDEPKPSFPTCYTPQGKFTDAVALGALSIGIVGKDKDAVFNAYQGKYCSNPQKLLCIEE